MWTMCWKRWYDLHFLAFRSFSEDEKRKQDKGLASEPTLCPIHFCPQCGQLTGVSSADGCGVF